MDFDGLCTFISERAGSDDYAQFMTDLACKLIDIETTPTQPLADIVKHEQEVLALIETAIRGFADETVSIERQPVTAAIAEHPYYTRPYYTADADNPQGLDVESTYRDRYNLLVLRNGDDAGSKGKPAILNAHVDTVAPFFPSKVQGGFIHGRGALDDKGLSVMLIAGLKLLGEVRERFGALAAQPAVYQFVIEEETGGNGTLSASLDERFAGYEAIVCECTGSTPHPANRGAMWFKLVLDTQGTDADVHAALPFVLVRLAREGQKLREETDQPLFPKDYVQVNFGTLNSFGEHPSAINDYLAFQLDLTWSGDDGRKAGDRLAEIIEAGLAQYTAVYADRTAETDDETAKPKLETHYRLTAVSEGSGQKRYKLEIVGLGGHMSAMVLRDNALIKAGYVLKELVVAYQDISGVQLAIQTLEQNADPRKLTLAGGVGFSPAHAMADLKPRLRQAVLAGIKDYAACAAVAVPESMFEITFDMLHNEAYASPVDCPAMKAFKTAFDRMGLAWPKPVAFRASCDARILGHGGHDTVTFGPGNLIEAHSDHEKIRIDQLQKGLELITLMILALTTGHYE